MQQPDMNVVITERNKMMIKIIKKAYQTVAGRIRDGDGMLNIFILLAKLIIIFLITRSKTR